MKYIGYSGCKLKLIYIVSAITDTKLQIMDTIEKTCFLSLIFWMQPLNQITDHKIVFIHNCSHNIHQLQLNIYFNCNRVGASRNGVRVSLHKAPMLWKHPGCLCARFTTCRVSSLLLFPTFGPKFLLFESLG